MMKRVKYLMNVLMLSFVLAFSTPAMLQVPGQVTEVQAAVKINKKSVKLTVGQTTTLKIIGTSKKVTWKTSNSKVATVNKKGKVTAKKKGTATVTGTVGKKKYTCKVTVSEKKTTYVWIPKTGSKYHAKSSCSNMKNPTKVTLSEAKKRGYDPCKKCY